MSNEIQVFKHKELGTETRIMVVDERIYFNLHDAVWNLGYVRVNSIGKQYLRKDKILNICETLGIVGVTPSVTDLLDKLTIKEDIDFETTYIAEQDFYDLALESKAINARHYRKWITSEVLPTIHKHGAYMKSDVLDKFISDPEFGIKLLNALKEERDKRKELEEKNKELQPKADFTDRLLKSKDLLLVREFSKVLQEQGIDLGEKKLYKWLRSNEILSDSNEPYQRYMKYFAVIERPIDTDYGVKIQKTTKIRPEGQLYLFNRIKKELQKEKDAKSA
jgi:prophage antirepressor-like protein